MNLHEDYICDVLTVINSERANWKEIKYKLKNKFWTAGLGSFNPSDLIEQTHEN